MIVSMRNVNFPSCKTVLLSPLNCHFSLTVYPRLLGTAVWEKDEELGVVEKGGGSKGVFCWKKPVDLSAGIFSPPPPPLNETHNKASSVCGVSSSIHVPCGKHSPSFSKPPHDHPLLTARCLTRSFTWKQDAWRELLRSKISSLMIRKHEFV